MTVVVDASIAAAWLLPEEDSDAAEAVIMALSDRAPVPSLFWHEARNIFVMAERRGGIVAGEPAARWADCAGCRLRMRARGRTARFSLLRSRMASPPMTQPILPLRRNEDCLSLLWIKS